MAQEMLNKAKAQVREVLEEDVINMIEITRKKHKNYTIIKYDKSKCVSSQYFRVGYNRCLVVDRDLDKIVCVGPTNLFPLMNWMIIRIMSFSMKNLLMEL